MNKDDFKDLIEKIINVKKDYDMELELMCMPNFSEKDGEFLGFKTFLLDRNVTSTLIVSTEGLIARVLDSNVFYNKNSKMTNYIYSKCTCDLDTVEQCKCKLSSKEEAEKWWWNETFKMLEKRNEELRKLFKIA